MIVSKGRKSLQSHTPTRLNDGHFQGLFETQNYNRKYYSRQRHSVGTISPCKKNINTPPNSALKRGQKKYDYLVHQQQNMDNYHMYQNPRYIVDSHERISRPSMHHSIQKFSQSNQKQNLWENRDFDQNRYINANQSKNQQIIKTNDYFKASEPNYRSIPKKQNPSYKQNRQTEKNYLNRQNFIEKSFNTTDKLKQFSGLSRLHNLEELSNKGKYESKYARMRNKRCELSVNQQNQFLLKQQYGQQKTRKEPNKQNLQEIEVSINYENLLKDTQSQNIKIKEKISRISSLNQQIDSRLQKMLLRRNIA